MIISISGKPAVLKQGFSFDYIVENRLFMGRDGYTLPLTFPLLGCPQNLAIFGSINHVAAGKRIAPLPASIQSDGFVLDGMISIVNVSDSEVQAQFIQGRCAQTSADPFEKKYINELTLGSCPLGKPSNPENAWLNEAQAEAIALPFVNTNQPTALNNEVVKGSGAQGWVWARETGELAWMPYLIRLAAKICDAVGYTYDFSKWRASRFRNLVSCNALPSAWELSDYADALPRWTVTEFFEKLELLMGAEFEINHISKHISMEFTSVLLSDIPELTLENILDEYSSSVSKEDNISCDYLLARGVKYADNGSTLWKYRCCEWLENEKIPTVYYSTINELMEKNKFHESNGKMEYGDADVDWKSSRLHARDIDASYAMRAIGTCSWELEVAPEQYMRGETSVYVLESLNIFGGRASSSGIDNRVSIEFVPVPIEDTYISSPSGADFKGYRIFLSPGSTSGDTDDDGFTTPLMRRIERGKTEKEAFYDKIFVGYWNGTCPGDQYGVYPITDSTNVLQDWSGLERGAGESFRLSKIFKGVPNLDPSVKYSFSWLSNKIPSPRAIFNIRGRRYICEKITATFTENGMSQLLKGEFYLADY